jgi:hypothetical protein
MVVGSEARAGVEHGRPSVRLSDFGEYAGLDNVR